MTAEDTHEITDAALACLSKVFTMVEVWRERIHTPQAVPEVGSCLAGDDRATAPYQLSHAVVQVLISAVDHLETLRLVVQGQHVLPARGGFTLLRAALENAAVAVWLLAPASRNERVFRLLRWEWADAQDDDSVMELMAGMSVNAGRAADLRTSAAESREERKRKLQGLARARRMSEEQVSKIASRPVPWRDIVEAAGDHVRGLTGTQARWAWTICSGLAHARRWAVLSFLKREESAGSADHLSSLKITATEEQLAVMANVAGLMLTEAWRLHDERRRSFLET